MVSAFLCRRPGLDRSFDGRSEGTGSAATRALSFVGPKVAGSRPTRCLQLAHLGCIFNKSMRRAEVAVHGFSPQGTHGKNRLCGRCIKNDGVRGSLRSFSQEGQSGLQVPGGRWAQSQAGTG